MFSINIHRAPSKRELRSFGLILAAGFLIIAFSRTVFHHQGPAIWAVMFGVTFGVAGLLVPSALRQVYQVWMRLAYLLGLINSKILLGTLYYALVTPLRLLLKLVGFDPMNRKFDPERNTYRVVRKPRPVSHMNHQF